MKILMWNVRGANSNEFLSHACKVLHTHKPTIFILVETKNDEARANSVSHILGFYNYKVVSPIGEKRQYMALLEE